MLWMHWAGIAPLASADMGGPHADGCDGGHATGSMGHFRSAVWRIILAEDAAMKPLIQLHLEIGPEKFGAANLPSQEREELKPAVSDERVIRILRRAAHRAGTEFRRSGTGIFSK